MPKQFGVSAAILVAAILIASSIIFYSLRSSQPQPVVDEVQLSQKITQNVLAELQKGDFMQKQVEAGIENYIQKQRDAQVNAQKEQERLANEKAKNVRRVSATRDHIYGDPNAEISLLEYSDFECPYCKVFHPTAKQVVDAYPGKVNLVYRHYPLAFHNPGAQKEAEATECANELGGNEVFWKYMNAIYERTTSNGKGFPIEKLVPLAEEFGLNTEQFQACLDGGKYAKRVQEDLEEGSQSGISGTPGNILLNNKTGETRLKVGALPLDAFKTDIEQMLQK